MPIHSKVKEMHSLLQKAGADVGDLTEFNNWFFAKGDEGYNNRKYVFDTFKQAGADVGDSYEDFAGMLGLQRVQPGQANPSRVDNESFDQTIANARQTIGQYQQTANRIGNRQQRIGLDLPKTDFGRINLGENRKVTKGQQRVNLDTGRLENTYITEAGNEYETRAGADIEQNAVDDARRRELNPITTQLEDLYAEQRRIEDLMRQSVEEGDPQNRGFLDKIGEAGLGSPSTGDFRNASDFLLKNPKTRDLMAAYRKNREAITTLEDQRDHMTNEFWHSLGTEISNGYNFSLGGSSRIDDIAALNRASKYKDIINEKKRKGEQLTQEEQVAESVLRNSAWDQQVQAQYGDEYGAWARAGKMGANSADFMLDFLMMGGMPAGTARGIMGAVVKGGEKYLGSLATKGFGRFMLKTTGATLGSMVAGAEITNTIQLGKTGSEMAKSMMGDVYRDANGNFIFGHYEEDDKGNPKFVEGGKDFFEALAEVQRSGISENASEIIGTFLPGGGKALSSAGGQLLEKLGLSKISRGITALSGKKWFQNYNKFLETAGFNGVAGEGMEEYAGMALDALMGGDEWKNLADPRTHIDIWLGVATMSGIMNAPNLIGAGYSAAQYGYSAAQYQRYKQATNKADVAASATMPKETWNNLRETIDNTDNANMTDVAMGILDNNDLTDEAKRASMDYINNLQKMRGYSLGSIAVGKDGDESEASRIVNESYTEGYDTQEPDLMKQYREDLNAAIQELPQYGQEFAKMVETSESPVEMMDYLMQNRDTYSDDQIAAAADYYQKQARLNGVMDGALDRIDLQVEQANAEVRSNTHQATGNVVMAKGADDLDYYIIGGDFVTDPETGFVSLAGTGGAVVVKDSLGNVSVKSPMELTVYSMQPADGLIQQNETELRQQLMQQADDDMTFGSPANEVYQLEDTVTLNDGEGNTITGEVVGMPNSIDGVYQVQTNDTNEPMKYLTADQLNRMIVSHNGQEVQRASAQPPKQQIENSQKTSEAVTNGDNQGRDVQPHIEDVSDGEGGGTDVPPSRTEEPQSALSRIPVLQDEKGQPVLKKGRPQYQWHKASVEDAAAALIETTGGDKLMARDNANRLVKTAQAKLEKIRKQEPKGEDPIELAESSLEIKRTEKEVQDTIKQWRDVAASIQKQMNDESAARQAEIEAAKSAEQKAREAEEARQREEKQKEIDKQRIREQIEKDKERRNKEYTPLVKAREEMAGDTDALAILNDVEPRSLEEWVSSLLRPHSMLWHDVSKNEVGLQTELGLKRADMQRMMSLLGTKESGAKPFGNVVLDIYEALPEGMKNQHTDEDVRNTLLNLFNEGSSARMMHLTEENRIAEAREKMLWNLRRDAEAEMEAWAEAYHLTPEERETYEDFLAAEMMNGAETEYINQIIADEEQNSRGEALDMQPASGTAGRESEGGEKQVQGQGAAETAAADQEQPGSEQGAETPSGESPVSGDNVPGGEQSEVIINDAENYSNFSNEDAESDDKDLPLPDGWDSLPTNDVDNEKTGQHIKGLKSLLDDNYKELVKAYGSGRRDNRSLGLLRRARTALRQELDRREQKFKEWQEKYNIKEDGQISLEDLSRLFHDHNKNEILGKLFDKVAEVARQIGLDIRFDNDLNAAGVSQYTGNVRYNTGLLCASGYNNQDIARVILHELIHSVTQSTVSALKSGGKYADHLTESQKKAAQQIIDIFNELKDWAEKNGHKETYGFKSPHEMLAEMASPNFRTILQSIKTKEKKSLWEILKGAIHGIFSLTKETDAEKRIAEALDDLVENFSMATFNDTRDYNIKEEWLPIGATSKEPKLLKSWMTQKTRAKKSRKVELLQMPETIDNDGNRHVKIGRRIDGGEIKDSLSGMEIPQELIDYDATYHDDGATMEDDQQEGAKYTVTEVIYLPDGRILAKGLKDNEKTKMWLKEDPLSFQSQPIGKTSSPEEIEAERQKVDTNPTEGQKKAENYQQGHIRVDGYKITIENPKGSIRRGVKENPDGTKTPWENQMHNDYGKILGTEGTDGDHIDVFLSDNPTSGSVFVVDQVNPDTGEFDEHKVMYGFGSEEEAREAYLSNYSKGWKGLGNITEVSREDFKKWIQSSHRKTKPFAEYAMVKDSHDTDMHRADGKVKNADRRESLLRDAIVALLRSIGIEVSTDWKLGQRILDEYNGRDPLSKSKKRALETASLPSEEDQPTVVSSADGAKVRQNSETDKDTDEKIKQHKVYHGSGAEFDEFDHSHMGEGQGSQSFGYGTYVSNSKKIGEDYANLSAKEPIKTVTHNGKVVRQHSAWDNIEGRVAGFVAGANGNIEDARAHILTEIGYAEDELKSYKGNDKKKFSNTIERIKGNIRWYKEYLKAIDEGEWGYSEERMPRVVYDVEIPDDTGSNYLEWKQPYNDSLPKALLEKLGEEKYAQWSEEVNRLGFNSKSSVPYSGRNAYKALSKVLGSDKDASQVLSEIGFVGIKYPAGTIMGGGDGATNYVIFNEGDAKITDRTKFFRTPDGHAYGYTYKGKIYVDPRIATSETPVHEYGHLWVEMKRQTAPEEWNHIKQVMLGDELVQPIIEKVKRDYPELAREGKEDDFIEEIITQFSGKRGSERLKEIADEVAAERGGIFGKAEAVTAMQRLKNILNSFWEGVAKMMGWKYRNANQIADRIMADMLNGVDPRQRMKEADNGKLRSQAEVERTLMGVHNLSEDKLRKVLKQGGLANPSLAVVDTKNHMHTDYGSISLIPKASLIDARTGRNAGTFTADAWTPTYPTVQKRMSDKGQDKFWKDLRTLREEDGEMANFVRMAFDTWLDKEVGQERLAYWYLKEKGMKPEMIRNKNPYGEDIVKRIDELTDNGNLEVSRLPEEQIKEVADMYHAYKESIGEPVTPAEERIKRLQERMNPDKPSPFLKLQQFRLDELAKYGELLHNLNEFEYAVRRSADSDGKPNVEATVNNAQKTVKDQNLQQDFDKWLQDKADSYGIEEWLYNGTDDRTGKQKWVRNTLQNASKLMKKEGLNGAVNWSSIGNWIAKVANKEKTLAGIRKNKKNLQTSEEEHEAFREKWSQVMYDIATKLGKGDSWRGEDIMSDILDHKDYAGYLKREYGMELSKEDREAIDTFINEVQTSYPTGYFETKFERPVMLNEFEIAVVPENTSADIVEALKNAGLDVRTYDDTGTEEQKDANRTQATMDAVQGRDDIMFQMIGKEGAAEADRAEGNDERSRNLTLAEDSEKAGVDPKAIKLATGWERGTDGQWRYEIPDADANVMDAYSNALKKKQAKASELRKNEDRLYEAYNRIASRIPDRLDSRYTEEQKANYREMRKQRDQLWKEYIKASNEYRDFREDVNKEITVTLSDVLGDGNELFKYYPEFGGMPVTFSNNMESGVAGSFGEEGIKLNLKETARFSDEGLNNESIYGTVLHEIQHAIQEVEGFARGGNLYTSTTEDGINAIIEKKERQRADIKTRLDANNKILSDPENLKMSAELEGKTEKEVRDQLTETVDQQVAEYDTLGLQIEQLRHTKAPSMTDAKDLYHRLAGEVESRNVTERMGMTEEQRRQSLASETEDVPREDQVIIDSKENENNSLYSPIDGPHEPESERPRYQKGEDALHYAERLAEYEKTRRMEEENVVIPDFTDEDIAQSSYNQTVAKKSLKWREAWQDGMISVKAIQDAIEKETGNKATGAEDAYLFENRMHGRSKNMGEQFEWSYYKPMLEAFSQFMKKTGMDIGQAMDYMIAKHGLERNMYYAFRDAMKSKIADEIKEEREKLEKQYAKGRMSELDYNKELARLKEKEATGVDDAISELRDSDEYKQLQQDYEEGKISYPEYIRGNEELRRNASMRKNPKRDRDGNIVSTNYYDDFAQDFSGLTGTLAKDMYDEAQKVKRAAQRTVDPETRKTLWQEYDRRMREAYQVAREEAERMVLDAESDREPADKLWKAINAATKRTLQISYDSGMMDRKTYNKVRSMFDYYIPLRGWDENKASDAYTYVGKENVFSPAVKKTWGRTSQAENPLAYIGNIAISTIIAGHRNMLKQHFLNYVMNNPTSLVSISESWYENIAPEGEAPVWVLRSADTAGKSTDEIAQIVNDFNEEMLSKQAEGKAIPVTGRLRLDVNATKGQKAEHVIEVQRAGHTYQLYINGDPKAAQALNGTLPKSVSRISDTYVGRQLTKLNRSMAAFFTSKNPAFVVSNLSRDLNMAGASVAVNENAEYNARFMANVAKVLAPRIGEGSGWNPAKKQPTGLMPSLLRKYKKGTLDPSDETERLFKEFMGEGGETGFVNMLSIDSFKEKLQGEIARMNGSSLLGSKGAKETSIGKAFRLLGDTFEFYNRCAEDATRFIVYMTSRQMGKSLEDSIADAKDVTLNFNRKGTGDKGNAEIRDLFIFVNPAIQALSNMYRMAKGHPLKFGAVTAAFTAGGALMPIINQWLLNMFGDDDDKEAYWNLPPWVRKNNLVMWIPGTKNFLTIPLAQEFRVFYGMGEMISCSVMDHSVGNMGMELVSSVADLVPINPTGNGGNLLVDLSPTGIQPLVQIGENIDFTGKPIWRENQGNKFAPMYTKAYVSTPGWMVKLSEKVNDVTGGNEGRKGVVEEYAPFWGSYLNNPAVWNHLLQGYFGGMYNTIAKGFDVITTAAGGEMPKIYQMPVVNRFLNRPVERDNAGVLGEEYYKLVNGRDQLDYELRVWKKKAADGDADAQKQVDEIMQSDDYKRSQVITHYEKIMKDLKAGEKAATEDYDKEDIKDMISMYKTQMMDELTDIDGGLDPLEAAKAKFNAAKTKADRILLQRRIERLMTIHGKDAKSSRDAVDKALSYRADELKDNEEGRKESAAYLKLATADNIVDDARIKAARAMIKPYLDKFKELEKVDGAEAVRYRSENLKWFNANNIISSQMGAMNTNKKSLGQGHDEAIMKLIDANRNRMLEAISELDKQ